MSYFPRDYPLETTVVGPTDALGITVTNTQLPRVVLSPIYGVLSTDVETLTDSGGTVTASGSLFQCAIGTTVGAYAVVRSRRTCYYLPGQALRARVAARFSTPGVASSLQRAGVFTASDGLFFALEGTTFGILRRIAGALGIVRLTVTAGTGGAETATITINGTATNVPLGGGLTTDQVAQTLAAYAGASAYAGWKSGVISPTSNGSTVTWLQNNPATFTGAFSMTSTGTATGTFATIQSGSPNNDVTGFVPQTSWNIDRLDGSGGTLNPSGFNLTSAVLANLNQFEIQFSDLSAGVVIFRYVLPTGEVVPVHRIEFPGSSTTPNQKNPAFRVGLIVASLGSATAITFYGGSGALFVEGDINTQRNPGSTPVGTFAADTNEYAVLAVRNRAEFSSVVNLREVWPHHLECGVETSNRIVKIQVYMNATLTGTVNWQYVNQSLSCVEYAAPAPGVTVSGGRRVASGSAASGAPATLNLHELDLRMAPGDVVTVTYQTVSSTTSASTSLNYQEVG